MARFKPGQHVVCVDKTEWIDVDKLKIHQHSPLFNQEYIVNGTSHYRGEDYISLQGHSGYFCDESFEPLIDEDTLIRELNSVPNPQLYA